MISVLDMLVSGEMSVTPHHWRLAARIKHYEEDGAIVFREACKLGCEGIVSKRLGSTYRRGRSPLWIKVKNPNAPAVKREAEEDWGRK